MRNKPLQGTTAKYVHEVYAGCKREPRISISPQLFGPEFTVVHGSYDAVALGWAPLAWLSQRKPILRRAVLFALV